MTAPSPLPVGTLCSPDDVQDRCVRTLTEPELLRAAALIVTASGKIKSFTRRTFTNEQTTRVLRTTTSIIKIPQVPVISIDNVLLVDYLGNRYPVPSFGFDGIDELNLRFYASVLNLPEEVISYGSVWAGAVELTWTYGYKTVPSEVMSTCAEMVSRVFNTPGSGVVGVQLERVGPYEMRLDGNGALVGIIQMTDEDKATLAPYRSSATTLELTTQ